MGEAEQYLTIKGNEPLLISDPEIFGILKSGSVALFSVALEDGVPYGTRHYLFQIAPQEALLGLGMNNCQDGKRGILAVAVEEAKLEIIAKDTLNRLWTNQAVSIAKLIETWVQQLGATIAEAFVELAVPDEGNLLLQLQSVGSAVNSDQAASTSLTTHYFTISDVAEEIFIPAKNSLTWVKIESGSARFMGFEELTVTPDSGLLPLSDKMWLEPEGTCELSTRPVIAISDTVSLIASIRHLHSYALTIINLLEKQRTEAEEQRFYERQRLNQQATTGALGKLASLLEPKDTDLFPQGSDILRAAGAVGRALQTPIRPPAKSENLNRVKNPLEAIARASRLRLRRVILADQWWLNDCGPLFGYWGEDSHPVALLPAKGGSYEIFDPNQNQRFKIDASSAAQLEPEAYMFYKPLPEKRLQAWDLVKFALSGRRRELITILVTGVAVSLLGMLIPQATAILIDTAIPDANKGLLWQLGLVLLAATFGSAIFQLTQGLASIRLQTLSDATTQAAVWDRLLNLRVSFFRQYSTGDLQSRVSAISQMRRLLSGSILQTLFVSLFSLLNLALLFYYSPSLAFVALLVAGVTVIFTTTSGILILRQLRPLLELEGQIFGFMVQLINGVSKLRVAGAEERAFAAWANQYTGQMKLTRDIQLLSDNLGVFNTIMPVLTPTVLFWVAWNLTTSGANFSTGTFLAFYVAFGIFINGATNLSDTVIDILEIATLWKRAQPILEAEPEIDLNKSDPGKLLGSIQLDHLTFRYRQDGPLNLDDVTINVQPGEFIALVGPSGSGKSTIFRLLLGFEVPESGTVRYDGQDLVGLDISAIRRQLGVVLQNGRINSASIFENISGGAVVSMDEAWEAAQLAGFADDIQSMPMGMHTVISEGGSNLSGGQRQRLLIARALVLKPKILLFDEATSALDNRTQAIVSSSLDRLDVTRIVVAHRLSTIRNADRIYVIEAGRVVQQGTFEVLADQEGLFKQLISRQIA